MEKAVLLLSLAGVAWGQCDCPKLYQPVCVGGITYVNPCEATCAGEDQQQFRMAPCDNVDCMCPSTVSPVCSQGITYINACVSDCANAQDVRPGECVSKQDVIPRRDFGLKPFQSAVFAGYARWQAHGAAQTDRKMDVLMDRACAIVYPGSSAAFYHQLLNGRVQQLPIDNDSGYAIIPKCSDDECLGRTEPQTFGGRARNCIWSSVKNENERPVVKTAPISDFDVMSNILGSNNPLNNNPATLFQDRPASSRPASVSSSPSDQTQIGGGIWNQMAHGFLREMSETQADQTADSKLDRAFGFYDVNGDGVVDAEELLSIDNALDVQEREGPGGVTMMDPRKKNLRNFGVVSHSNGVRRQSASSPGSWPKIKEDFYNNCWAKSLRAAVCVIPDSETGDVDAVNSECEAHCGGRAPSGCYCDDICALGHECCPGFVYSLHCANGNRPMSPVKPPRPDGSDIDQALSCEGFCGRERTSCSCMDNCKQTGNCCADVQDFCKGNQAPVMVELKDVQAAQGKQLTINLATSFYDSDGDHITYKLSGLPRNSGLTLNADGVLEGKPSDSVAGASWELTLSADDGIKGHNAWGTFTLTVTLAPAGTCAGACGLISEEGCWCDASCVNNEQADCCADFSTECVNVWLPEDLQERWARATFEYSEVQGTIDFHQIAEGRTSINVALFNPAGLMEATEHPWHVHLNPRDPDDNEELQFQLGQRCKSTGGHFNPTLVQSGTDEYMQACAGDPDQCEDGDLSGKHGPLALGPAVKVWQMLDQHIQLQGENDVIGRSITLHAGALRLACADILRLEEAPPSREEAGGSCQDSCGGLSAEGCWCDPSCVDDLLGDCCSDYQDVCMVHEIVAIARFDFPEVKGMIMFSQPLDSPTILQVALSNPSGRSSGHSWHVHAGAMGDGIDDCAVVGGHYNPLMVDLGEGYSDRCTPIAHTKCEVGDLANKHGALDLSEIEQVTMLLDDQLPLSGPLSVIGRSIVIHAADGSGERLACGDIKLLEGYKPIDNEDGWEHCAFDTEVCSCTGEIRYGAKGSWLGPLVAETLVCEAQQFGDDPMPGVLKTCDCLPYGDGSCAAAGTSDYCPGYAANSYCVEGECLCLPGYEYDPVTEGCQVIGNEEDEGKDIALGLAPEASCAGKCDNMAEECFCDVDCLTTGDCCADYRTECMDL